MAAKRIKSEPEATRRRPATTPEELEDRMISDAYELAAKQLADGTASSQVITTFLKFGSNRERLEQQKLALENDFLEAKREALESEKRVEELYSNAISAMRAYSGHTDRDVED